MNSTIKSNLFQGIIGQEYAISLLQSALKLQRIAPAYLFTGPEGVGKRLIALRFLEGFLTQGNGSLKEKRRLKSLNHPDLLWIEPTYLKQGKLISKSSADIENINNRSSPQIRLEQIRNISKFLSNKTIEASSGMVVIEDVDEMNEAAANALLKTLEEPVNGLLILISTNPERLLTTILSRCQIIRFSNLTNNQLDEILNSIFKQLDKTFTNEMDKEECLRLSNGSPGIFIRNLKMWSEIPDDLFYRLKELPREPLSALSLARDINDKLSGSQQLWIIHWLQNYIWEHTNRAGAVKDLEDLRLQLISYVQPRLAWEVALLKLMNSKN